MVDEPRSSVEYANVSPEGASWEYGAGISNQQERLESHVI